MSMDCNEAQCPTTRSNNREKMVCPPDCPRGDYGRVYLRCKCKTPQPVRGPYCALCGSRFANPRASSIDVTRSMKVSASNDAEFAVAATNTFVAISTKTSTRIVMHAGKEESREISPPENEEFKTAPRVGGSGSILRTVVGGSVYALGGAAGGWGKEFSLRDGEKFQGIPCELNADTIVAIVRSTNEDRLVIYDSFFREKAVHPMPGFNYYAVVPDIVRDGGCDTHRRDGKERFWVITHDAAVAKAEVDDAGTLDQAIQPKPVPRPGRTSNTFDLERALHFDEYRCGCRYLSAVMVTDDGGRLAHVSVLSNCSADPPKAQNKKNWRSPIGVGLVCHQPGANGDLEYDITWQ